jgi:hypothetical protein
VVPAFYLAAQGLGHQLHAVADAEDGEAQLEEGRVTGRGIRFVDAGRSAGKHDARGLARGQLRGGQVAAQDFAIDVELADTTRNELRVLRAEV